MDYCDSSGIQNVYVASLQPCDISKITVQGYGDLKHCLRP